jgi:nitric oxide dioxygenase
MISPNTIKIVKSTAPVLAEHGEAITQAFYKRLFIQHPEMKNIFNMTHQKKGTQPKVLANAIFMYAQYIDQLEVLGGAVESIAQKHVSLTITPEMYPIIGENLLAGIGEVLGDAATPEIVGAWAEAYQALADILIGREEDIYLDRTKKESGFRGHKDFVVLKKVVESTAITSFYLQRKDGTAIPEFQPGQYIALTLTIPNTTHQHTRNYSLSDCNCKDYLRISVKKETGTPDGVASTYLHENIEEGAVLSVGMPSGEFMLKEEDKPVVLIAGGVGITPLMSMYKYLTNRTNRKVTMIQCALNSNVRAFETEIEEGKKREGVRSILLYDQALETDVLGKDYDHQGYLDAATLAAVPYLKESTVYFCGPKAFMANTLSLLNILGVEEEAINYEFFGPAEELELVN